MFKIYYAAAIDTCVDQAFKQIEEFKQLFKKYEHLSIPECFEESVRIPPKNPIKVFGAGFGESPIIGPETSSVKKGVISAFDLRKIRECDVLLVVTDLKQFAAGTFMELEYARNLGIYTIIFVYGGKTRTVAYPTLGEEKPFEESVDRVKNIFMETYANKIIYSKEELEEILKDLTQ